ncbi:MAG TPA: OsmC family protein [Luteibacter sp.]|jgi:putative redox protein|nr:OsmC family protein [Luteibacter sp.]
MSADPGEKVIVEETGKGKFQVEARVGTTTILIDEPVMAGGLGTGPNPYDLLASALGACTVMTIRMYAERKKWPLSRVRAQVTHRRGTLEERDIFTREISLEGELDDAQRARLLDIAGRCPVHLTLHRGSVVETTLVPAIQPAAIEPAMTCEHMKNMEEACSP